eukprot:1161754-Pelagomonas_calceolata.AAC.7
MTEQRRIPVKSEMAEWHALANDMRLLPGREEDVNHVCEGAVTMWEALARVVQRLNPRSSMDRAYNFSSGRTKWVH